MIVPVSLPAADWPTYQQNVRRNAVTAESLDAGTLAPAWRWQSPFPPQPAWGGPAKWDAYKHLHGLRSMRNYDPVFHVVAVGDAVYFGSSADDSVRCLDADDGSTRWIFHTDGPVRVAPMFHDGRLYFGSDDGRAYAVDATDGRLVWKVRAGQDDKRIINNGRFISRWPCRGGVVVEGGIAYFTASLLPWDKSYLCAVRAEDGESRAERCFIRSFESQTMEGPLVLSPERIIVPQGRVAPRLFDRSTGDDTGDLKGGGGSFVVLTDDLKILHGPGNHAGWITASQESTREAIATYPDGNAMVVADGISYLLTDDWMVASDFVKRKVLWKVPNRHPFCLALAGSTLLAGGRDEVAAFDAADGRQLWSHEVDGNVHGLAVAGGRLLVSTDTGRIQAFRESEGRVEPSPPDTLANVESPPAPAIDQFEKLTKIEPIRDKDLLGRWVFQRPHVSGTAATDLGRSNHARLSREAELVLCGEFQAWKLDGTQSALIAYPHDRVDLPSESMTATAWVRIDKPQRWGGIIGAIQDDGDVERGWLLGFENSSFSFAVATESAGRLTYLAARRSFTPGRWHHVAGVYDGREMRIYVDGELQDSATDQRGPIRYPDRTHYEIGAYHDSNEHYHTTGMLHEVRVHGRALTPEEILRDARSKRLEDEPPPTDLDWAMRPYLRFVSPTSALLRWKTAAADSTTVLLETGERVRRFHDDALTTDHRVLLTDLRKDFVHKYRILVRDRTGERRMTRPTECDTYFNFTTSAVAGEESGEESGEASGDGPDGKTSRRVQLALRAAGTDQGICVVWGCADGSLATELARRGRFRVVAVDTDEDLVRRLRRRWTDSKLYGGRVVALRTESLDRLPLTGHCANLIVSERPWNEARTPESAAEIRRMLRPDGGVACLELAERKGAADATALDDWNEYDDIDIRRDARGTIAALVVRRGPLPGVGSWSHLYGNAGNSAFSGETLQGSRGVEDLRVQWIGRPGARYQPDRNGRKPSPLSTNGRLFLQGLQRIIALDAYNGTILWSLEIPDLGRFNMPRDCGNWCADDDHLFVAVADQCWRIDAASGEVTGTHDVVPGARSRWRQDWSYVARTSSNLVIGSSTKQASAFTSFWGGAGWYDAKQGEATDKVCSDNLFAFSDESVHPVWNHQPDGVIVNSTISADAGKLYFVESRHADVVGSESRRLGGDEFWRDVHLVAIDERTGERLWQRPLDVAPGIVMLHMAAAEGALAVVSSSDGKYHVHAFAQASGEPLWKQEFPWPSDNHGGHMSRPAVVQGRLYVRPRGFELATGRPIETRMPGGGCGTYACTTEAIFFRSGNVTVWDRQQGRASSWTRLRPDCWLSTVPAGGMLLSPEGGGGCSCGSWLETSIGFNPGRLESPASR